MVQHLNAAVEQTFDEPAPERRPPPSPAPLPQSRDSSAFDRTAPHRPAGHALHPTWLTRARRDHIAGNRASSSAEGTELWLVRNLSYKPENRCAERSL